MSGNIPVPWMRHGICDLLDTSFFSNQNFTQISDTKIHHGADQLEQKISPKKNNIQTLPKAPKTNRGDRTHHEDSSKGCPNPPPFK